MVFISNSDLNEFFKILLPAAEEEQPSCALSCDSSGSEIHPGERKIT